MIKQQVDVLFMDGELMLADTLRLYKGDNGILISVKVEKQYYKNNKLITENLIELGKYGRAIIRKGQHSCCSLHEEEEGEEPIYCSEVFKISDGRLDILIPAEAIDETSELGIYQIQIQLYGDDTDLGRPRLTLDPFEFEVCDLISEDEELVIPEFSDEPIVGLGQASEAILREDGELPVKLEDGSYNKTDWKERDVITAGRLNKMEEAMKVVYGIRPLSIRGNVNEGIANIVNSLNELPTTDMVIYVMITDIAYIELSNGSKVVISESNERNEATLEFTKVPTGLINTYKLKFTLSTNDEIILGSFTGVMEDTKVVLDNDKLNRIEAVDMTGMATENYVVETVGEAIDTAIDNIHTLEVHTVGNNGIARFSNNEYEIFDLNLENIKPDQENHFVFKKVRIPCKDVNGNDNTIYFDDTFVCITVLGGTVYEIKEFRTGVVYSISKSENNSILEYTSRPMTDIEYEHLKDINRIEEASAIEYFRNYFTRDGLYYFGNVSIKCIVGGKSKIVSFNERLVEITIYNSYLTLYDYKDCLVYKFNHNGSKITGFVGQGELTDAHEVRLNEQVTSAINNNIVPVYATKKELSDAIKSIPEVDLTGLASEDYVDSRVASATDNMATKAYVGKIVSDATLHFITDSEVEQSISDATTDMATKKYVTSTVTSATNGLASEIYVDKAIENIEIPEVDMTGIATEEFVDEAISNIHTLEVKTIGSDVMLLDDGDGYTEFDIDAELGSLVVGDEKYYVFKKVKITHTNDVITFEDDFVSIKCLSNNYSNGARFNICLTMINTGLKYMLYRRNDGKYKDTRLQETQTPASVEYTKRNTMGVTIIGEEGLDTEFDINLINFEQPNLNNFIFKGSVYISYADVKGRLCKSYFGDTSVSITVFGPYDDGVFSFQVKDNNGCLVGFYVESNGIVRLEGNTGSPVYPDDLEYILPIKRWNNKTITNAWDFNYGEPQLYFLNDVTISMADGNSYYFGNSTATMHRDDYTIYIYDHTNCREIFLNCNGSSIDSFGIDLLFTSISNEFAVKQIDYPPNDIFAGIRKVFGNAKSMRITPGFNALNSNGELTAFKFGKYYDSLVYYNHDHINKQFTIYSYEEMKTYTFSYPNTKSIPTLVSIESNMSALDIDLSNYATKEEFNSLSENVGSIETQLYDKVSMNDVRGELATYATKEELESQIISLQNQLGDIDTILDAINGEVL